VRVDKANKARKENKVHPARKALRVIKDCQVLRESPARKASRAWQVLWDRKASRVHPGHRAPRAIKDLLDKPGCKARRVTRETKATRANKASKVSKGLRVPLVQLGLKARRLRPAASPRQVPHPLYMLSERIAAKAQVVA
jgi:hypothetical protein